MSKEGLSPKQERNRKFVAETMAEKFYSIQMSEETKRKILEIKDILDKNPNLNFLILFNHTYSGDPLFAGHIANKLDSNFERQIIAPVSASHTVAQKRHLKFSERKENWFLNTLNKIAKSTGVKTLPIVQATEGDSFKEEAQKGYFNFFEELKKLSSDGGVGCIVSPEGHRSEDGKLQKGEKGIQLMAKILQPTIIIPLGIYFEAEEKDDIFIRKYKRSGLNFGKKVNINIGEYKILEKGQKMTAKEMMNLLADTLPLDLRSEEYLNDEQKKELAQMPEVRTIVKMSKKKKTA